MFEGSLILLIVLSLGGFFEIFVKKENLTKGNCFFVVYFFSLIGLAMACLLDLTLNDLSFWLVFGFFPCMAMVLIYTTKSKNPNTDDENQPVITKGPSPD